MLCLGLGTAAGLYLRGRRRNQLELLRAETEVLGALRLMLAEERLGLCELLERCASLLPDCEAAKPLGERFRLTAEVLGKEPYLGVSGAYSRAAASIHIPWEGAEERKALKSLFDRLGTGTASMREQAAAGCLRRLKPLLQTADEQSKSGDKLCVKLCMLLGLMLGIALW